MNFRPKKGCGIKASRKVAASLLLFSFAFSPFLAKADASESQPPEQSPSSSSEQAETPLPASEEPAEDTTGSPGDQDSSGIGTDKAVSDPDLPKDADSAEAKVQSPNSLLSIPGSNVESPDVREKALLPKFYSEPDPVTGSLNYSYPIDIPPGRNGVQPAVNLTYSSQPGTDVNEFGYGWDVSIPYVARLNKAGSDSH